MAVQIAGKLSRKQDLAIAALLTCPTLQAAAQQCGLSETTLWRWLKHDPGFQTAYRDARRELVRVALGAVQAACSDAVETLRSVMQDGNAPASARVAAARTVLDMSLKGVEVEDHEARVVALEAQTNGLPV